MDDNEDLKFACASCVKEEHLKRLINDPFEKLRTCSYCEEEEKCISIEKLADEVEAAFDRHFVRTSNEMEPWEERLQADSESDFEWHRKGTEVVWAISNAAGVSLNIAQDVLDILHARHGDQDNAAMGIEDEFDPESKYVLKAADDEDLRSEWDEIERSLKTRSRYFNRTAEEFFDRLFANLDLLGNHGGDRVIVTVGPGCETTSFFRARVFHNSEALQTGMSRPDKELAPPPASLARAGRMNAQGISTFYGAVDVRTAMAEVRPPVGSKLLIGRFDLLRQLRLLDIQALRSLLIVGSYFDPEHLKQLERAQFLRRLSEKMTMPVMPDDEASEYLITQMIADYLSRGKKPGLDGMIFPSVQKKGDRSNVVLFHHASRVERWVLPAGTEIDTTISLNSDDWPISPYQVWELVPPDGKHKPVVRYNLMGAYIVKENEPDDARAKTLSVARESLQVHHIESVDFETSEFPVGRSRYEQDGLPF